MYTCIYIHFSDHFCALIIANLSSHSPNLQGKNPTEFIPGKPSGNRCLGTGAKRVGSGCHHWPTWQHQLNPCLAHPQWYELSPGRIKTPGFSGWICFTNSQVLETTTFWDNSSCQKVPGSFGGAECSRYTKTLWYRFLLQSVFLDFVSPSWCDSHEIHTF